MLEEVIASLGRGVAQNNHSTDVESTTPPPRVCMSIHPRGKSCSDLGRVLVLTDPGGGPGGARGGDHSVGGGGGGAGREESGEECHVAAARGARAGYAHLRAQGGGHAAAGARHAGYVGPHAGGLAGGRRPRRGWRRRRRRWPVGSGGGGGRGGGRGSECEDVDVNVCYRRILLLRRRLRDRGARRAPGRLHPRSRD
jgi:hypothetical protein